MTNYDKFFEVFGVEPDTDSSFLACPPHGGAPKCEWYKEFDGGCHCEQWWDQEYKEDSSQVVSVAEIEKGWESISDVAEGSYVDMEEVKLWFAKWLGKDEDEL